MPAPRRPRLPRELFETRSHAWHSLGLGDELAPKFSKRQFGGLLLALLVIAGTLFVYYQRKEIAPGYGQWIRIGTAVILVTVGSAAAHWLVRGLSPRLYRRLDPATAGTTGFVVRLLATAAVVVLALRIVGVNSSTLAVGGAFTAVLLGLAAQQAMSGIFAGIVLQSTRPFRVGERVRLVGGAQAGPQEIEERLLQAITVPTRYKPSVSLEELDGDVVVFRVSATPLRAEDGSQLAEEVLDALRRSEPVTAETPQA